MRDSRKGGRSGGPFGPKRHGHTPSSSRPAGQHPGPGRGHRTGPGPGPGPGPGREHGGDRVRPHGAAPTKPRSKTPEQPQGRPHQRSQPHYNKERQRADRPPAAGRAAERPQKGWRPRPSNGPVVLYGWHTVKAALANPARKFHRLLLSGNALRRLQEDGVAFPIAPTEALADEIAALVGPDAVHQGLYAEADPLPAPDIDALEPKGILLVLDQITDPHNVGAILRSAAAFGVSAVITTERHSPEASGVLAKAASGAVDHVPIITVPNLARALTALKDNFVQLVGLDSEGDADLAQIALRTPLALVLGAEGKGLRHLTRVTCDQLARLDLPGPIASLNVSNAAALALYIAATRASG